MPEKSVVLSRNWIVWFAALNVAALFYQFTHLMRWNGFLTLRANIESRGRQRVVAPSHSLFRWGFPAFRNCHDSFSREIRCLAPCGDMCVNWKSTNYNKQCRIISRAFHFLSPDFGDILHSARKRMAEFDGEMKCRRRSGRIGGTWNHQKFGLPGGASLARGRWLLPWSKGCWLPGWQRANG